MLTARLHDNKLVFSYDYQIDIHGNRLFCVDKKCNAPLIFIPGNETKTAHFKTSGKGESKHNSYCGFYKSLDLVGSIKKVKEYQSEGFLSEAKEVVIRLSMNRIDPDKETSTIEREKKKKDTEKVKVKNDNITPQTISSVKGVVKLLTEYEPDILSSVLINVGGGRKIPISEIITDQEQAHNLLWEEKTHKDIGYFVYGTVSNVVKREKVMYINFEEKEVPFTIVIFNKHWANFSYSEQQITGKNILVYGHLRKNSYKDINLTEMIIKSDKYLEVFSSNRKSI